MTGIRRLGRHVRAKRARDRCRVYRRTDRLHRAPYPRPSRQAPARHLEAAGFLDDDGFTDVPVHLQAQIEITDDRIHFDLTGSDQQRPAPVNAPYALTFAACAYALKCLIDPDVPVNDGFYRVISAQTLRRYRRQ